MSLSLVTQAFSVAQTSKAFSSTGTLKKLGVGVYKDSQCNIPLSSLPWGLLEPNSPQYVTAYIRNEGNAPTIFSLHSINWRPMIAEDYISLTWDYNGDVIDPEDSIKVTFILTVSQAIEDITTFDFDIVIVGTG